MIRRMLFLTALAFLPAPLLHGDDAIDGAVRDLKNKKYGAYWDRLKACKALGRADSAEAARALALALVDPDLAVREEAALAYSKMRSEGARTVLYEELLLRDKSPLVRAGAAWAIRLAGDEGRGAASQLARALADRSGPVRAGAARAIGALGLSDAGEALQKGLLDTDAQAAAEKLRAVAALRLAGAKEHVLKLTRAGHPLVRAEALQALAVLDPKGLSPLAEKAAKDARPEARMGLLYALMLLPADDAFSSARLLVADRDWRVRAVAIELLAKIREKRCIGPMIEQMGKEQGRLRYDFAVALESITGKDLGYDAKTWASWWKAVEKSFRVPKEVARKEQKKKEDGSVATFFGIPILSTAATFAIDFSGSMKNNVKGGKYDGKVKIDVAFEQLEQALARFETKQHFSAIQVSTEATARKKRLLMPKLVPASKRNKYVAIVSIKKIWKELEPIKRGRGDFYDAMVEGAEQLKADTLLLLSDGNPSSGMYIKNENFVPEWVRFNKYRRIMVHTILIGGNSRPARELAEGLARETGGQHENLTAEPKKPSRKKRPPRKKKSN